MALFAGPSTLRSVRCEHRVTAVHVSTQCQRGVGASNRHWWARSHPRRRRNKARPSTLAQSPSSNVSGEDSASGSTGDGEGGDSMVIMSGVTYGGASREGGDSPSEQAVLPGSTPQTRPKLDSPENVNVLKVKLLAAVSGLDRGISAFPRQQREVDALAAALETSLDGQVSLSSSDSIGMAELKGRWRLVYSSGFGSGSLGGRQPGPPSTIAPFTLGQVFQDINPATMQLNNVVELCFRVPSLPFTTDDQDPVTAELTLGHSFTVSDGRKVVITFETTEVNVQTPWPQLGSLPSLALPQLPETLRPPTDLRSAAFDVSFLDDEMRVTRGDRGELRVYVRA